ncbi:hypothetical protein [Nonomuraea sp. NPDC049695]|uniref:hypothetical protein n=1 Tax=Nonomuraea sp. NPDC049695 TaxID=3154734 RepID=UPI00344872B5
MTGLAAAATPCPGVTRIARPSRSVSSSSTLIGAVSCAALAVPGASFTGKPAARVETEPSSSAFCGLGQVTAGAAFHACFAAGSASGGLTGTFLPVTGASFCTAGAERGAA